MRLVTLTLLSCQSSAPGPMMDVPAGWVSMGVADGRGAAGQRPWVYAGGAALPARRVWVDAFAIDRAEVTRAQYRAFLVDTGYRIPYVDEQWAGDGGKWGVFNWSGLDYPEGTGDHPVVLVNVYDAAEYCRWAGKRLPTEAEWQLAAFGALDERGGRRAFPWGDTYDGAKLNHGSFRDPFTDATDGWAETSPVGSFPEGRSPVGADDLFGNAWELTADWRVDDWSLYAAERHGDDLANPASPGPGLYVAVRGGSYFFDLSVNPAAERTAFVGELRRKTTGFRCAAGG